MRERIDQQLLVIGDGIIDLFPRPGIDDRHIWRQGWCNHRLGYAATRVGATEIGIGHGSALPFPATEMLLHQLFKLCRIGIPRNRNHQLFWTIPTAMEFAQARRCCGIEAGNRTDCRTVGEPLPLKGMLAHRFAQVHSRTSGFAQFGLNDGALCIQCAF